MADFRINVIVNTRQAETGVTNVDRKLTSIERSLNRLRSLFASVFAIGAIGGAVRAITGLSDALLNAQNRLRTLGFEGARTAQVTAQVFKIANDGRVAFEGVAETFARTTRSLRNLGASEQEVIQFTDTLTKAVAISGATTAEADGALRQFSQGLGRGELRGQELISVLEQLPIVADIIAKSLGVNVSQLNALAAQGTITGEVIRRAFAEAREEIVERFGRTIPTISSQFQVLRNRLIEVAGGFLQSSGASQNFGNAIRFVADNLEDVLRSVAALSIALTTVLVGKGIASALVGLKALGIALKKNPFTALAVAISTAISFLIAFSDKIFITVDGLVRLDDFVVAVFNRLRTAASAATGPVIGFLTSIAEAVDGLVEKLFDFSPALEGLVTSVIDFFANLTIEDVIRGIASGLDVLVALFSAAVAAIEAVADNFGPVLQDAFISGLNLAISAIENGLELIINGFLSLPGLLSDAAFDAVAAFGGSIVAGFNTVIDFVKTIPGRIKDALAGLFSSGLDAGADLVTGIATAIDEAVDIEGGRVAISLGRLENPAKGALAEVGRVSGEEFSRVLREAPVSAGLEGALEDARVAGVARGIEVGTEIGAATGAAVSAEVLKARESLQAAVSGLTEGIASFLNISDTQLEQLGTNFSDVFNRIGVNIGGVFTNAISAISSFAGVSNTELANLGGVAGIIFDELGIDIEEVFGPKAATAIRIFSRITSDQLSTIFDVGSRVFTGLGGLITNLGPSLASFGSAAVAAFSSATAGATALSIALSPITLTILAIVAAVVILIFFFDDLKNAVQFAIDVFKKFALILIPIRLTIDAIKFLVSLMKDLGGAVQFAIDVFKKFALILIPIRLTIDAIKFLIDLFKDFGNAGSTAGKIVRIALAPIVIPIKLIIDAIKFLINLFGSLGSIGSATSKILRLALLPIVVPIKLIIEAFQFLVRLLTGDVSGAFNLIGNIGKAVANILIGSVKLVINIIKALISLLTGGLAGAFNFIGNLSRNIFNGILAAGRASFNGIAAAGKALGGALGAVAKGILGAFSGAFKGVASIAKSTFNTIVAGARSALNSVKSLASSVGGAVGGAIGGVIGGVKKVGSSIKKGIKSLFARGGIITGPVALSGPDVAGRAFQGGGVLSNPAILNDLKNINSGSGLGVAGEAGPEAILPLAKTSAGLGVTATLSDSLLAALTGNRGGRDGGSGTTVINNRIAIIETSNLTVEELREQVLDLGASIEPRVDVTIAEILGELAA